jgi:hypothetical protein
MQGYKVSFNVFAESQEEADRVSRLLGSFVNDCASRGVAVTATKINAAVSKWGGNAFIRDRINNYFRNG